MTDKDRQLSGERAICLVRWGLIVLVLLVAWFDPGEHLSPSDRLIFLVAAVIYNLAITALLGFRLFFRFLPVLTLLVDILIQMTLLHMSGGANSPYFIFSVFPIMVASLRFGWLAGLLATGIFFLGDLFQTVGIWQVGQEADLIFQFAWRVLLYIVTAVVAGVVGERVAPMRLSDLQLDASEQPLVPEELKMVYEMASTLSATLNYERVLDAILDISRLGFDELGMRVGESVGMVVLYDADGLLSVVSYRNLMVSGDEFKRIKGVEGIVGEAISSAEAVLGKTPATDPELSVFRSLDPCKSMICVPLRAGFETYGAVLFASVKPDTYTADHVGLLTIFCNQATIALQNASLYQSLREERDKIVNKEEEARHKLARDLHDGPTQDVAAIAMRLNFARLLVERDPARARAELGRLEDLAHRTVKEIRSMLFTLRPIILETEGLVAALNQYAENLRENDNLPVEIDPERYKDCLDIELQGVVFAILEEAINNARKHAQASRIWVRLAVDRDLFVAQVIDNGRGFDVQAVESNYGSRGSLGMVNLKERAELIGGTVNIESTLGQGTRITLLVPLPEPL